MPGVSPELQVDLQNRAASARRGRLPEPARGGLTWEAPGALRCMAHALPKEPFIFERQ
jgi:hypothetical protein